MKPADGRDPRPRGNALRPRRQSRLNVCNRRRVLERCVVPGAVAHQHDVIVVVDDARHHGPAAQIDEANAGAGARRRTADAREPAVAHGDSGDDRVLRIHRMNASVDEDQFFVSGRRRGTGSPPLRSHVGRGEVTDGRHDASGDTGAEELAARQPFPIVIRHGRDYTTRGSGLGSGIRRGRVVAGRGFEVTAARGAGPDDVAHSVLAAPRFAASVTVSGAAASPDRASSPPCPPELAKPSPSSPGCYSPADKGATVTQHIGRRETLKRGLTAVAALAVVPEWALPALAQGDVDVPFTDIPATFNPAPAGGARRFLDLRKIDGMITPSDQFFFIQHFDRPEIDPARHRLKLTGLVDKPVELSLADLQSMKSVDVVNGYECSGNSAGAMQGLSSNGRFTGVRLRDVLRRVGVDDRAREVVFFGADKGNGGRRVPPEHDEAAAAVRPQHHARTGHEGGADDCLGAQRPAAATATMARRCASSCPAGTVSPT